MKPFQLTDEQKVEMFLSTGVLFKCKNIEDLKSLHGIKHLNAHVLHRWYQETKQFAIDNHLSSDGSIAWIERCEFFSTDFMITHSALDDLAVTLAIHVGKAILVAGENQLITHSLEMLNFLVWETYMEP